jgi:signal transduction histidine kinase
MFSRPSDRPSSRKELDPAPATPPHGSPEDVRRPPLGLRIALWYAGIFTGSSLALIALTYLLLSASLRRYDHEIIQTTLVEYAAAYRRGGVPALAAAIGINQAAAGYEPLFVRAVGPFANVVYRNPENEWEQFDLSQLTIPARTGEESWALLNGGARGDQLEVASVRLHDGTLFQVGKSTARRRDLLRRFRTVLLLDFVTVVAIGLAGGAMFTSSALRPVRELTRTVREIMRTGRIRSRVPAPDTADALAELGHLFNAMLDRIEALIAGMRGALDNVAHDLRTPMMRLRGIAETALQSPADPAALREALADCLEESERVVAMLNTLMDISEAETGTMKLQLESVNLSELIASTLELYEDLAEEKGIALRRHALDEVWIEADRNRMRQVLANLLDNAVKYTPSGGQVDVTARRDGPDALLTVRDTGIGIAEEDLPRIWERLYRGDESRSERGLGLGLSLVKAIVEAHGGRVSVVSTPGQGSTFDLRLPTARSPS